MNLNIVLNWFSYGADVIRVQFPCWGMQKVGRALESGLQTSLPIQTVSSNAH